VWSVVRELRAHIVEVAELAAVEERALDLPKRALLPWLVVGVPASYGERTNLVVAREREKERIADGLIALPAQYDRLLAVVLAPVLRCRSGLDPITAVDRIQFSCRGPAARRRSGSV
jgi:hypothetical protein